MKQLYILKTGTTYPAIADRHGDFEDWTAAALGAGQAPVAVVAADRLSVPLPAADRCAGIVITGSHAMVTDHADWMKRLENWLAAILPSSVPILGICFGHQLLARAAGGKVDYHPRGQEVGLVEVRLSRGCVQDALFSALPASFSALASHAQSVIALPSAAVHLAANDFEPHHAYRLGDRAWGVQFHPEFTAAIMRAYVRERSEALQAEGFDPPALLDTLADAPVARQIMRRFRTIADQ